MLPLTRIKPFAMTLVLGINSITNGPNALFTTYDCNLDAFTHFTVFFLAGLISYPIKFVVRLLRVLFIAKEITKLHETFFREDIDNLKMFKNRIKGELSNVSAEITNVVKNQAKFNVDFSNRQEYGWLDDIGKLNEDYQVIPDNDYYQNLSYTVKSSIEWEKFVNPVNRLVHPSGLKNFADTSVTSNISVGVGEVRESNQVVVLDVGQ